ncbi:uncharacterized protein [Physcomitrium patens]|uniref:uncharacterized protein isoform X3 n=1 Tax=Physcomitrium patens TaxID=3218 RepID=UPI003CCE1F28
MVNLAEVEEEEPRMQLGLDRMKQHETTGRNQSILDIKGEHRKVRAIWSVGDSTMRCGEGQGGGGELAWDGAADRKVGVGDGGTVEKSIGKTHNLEVAQPQDEPNRVEGHWWPKASVVHGVDLEWTSSGVAASKEQQQQAMNVRL